MNEKQQRFVEEYLVDLNATQAAIRAGYSARTAEVQGSRLLSNAKVQQAVREAMKARSERTQITADRVLQELALIGFSSVDHYHVDDAGFVQADAQSPDGAIRAIASMKRKKKVYTSKDGDQTEEIDTEIKLWNKNTALQDLGKHLGLFGPKGTEEDPQHVAMTWRVVHADKGADGT